MTSEMSNWTVSNSAKVYTLTTSPSGYGYGAAGPLSWTLGGGTGQDGVSLSQSYDNRFRVKSVTSVLGTP
jgi:hypothetical protein